MRQLRCVQYIYVYKKAKNIELENKAKKIVMIKKGPSSLIYKLEL